MKVGLRMLVINRSSLRKFSEGGAARLVARKRNHQVVKKGVREAIPLIIKIFRVWVSK